VLPFIAKNPPPDANDLVRKDTQKFFYNLQTTDFLHCRSANFLHCGLSVEKKRLPWGFPNGGFLKNTTTNGGWLRLAAQDDIARALLGYSSASFPTVEQFVLEICYDDIGHIMNPCKVLRMMNNPLQE